MPSFKAPPDSVAVDDVALPPDSSPVDEPPSKSSDTGPLAMAKDVVNRTGIALQDLAGGILDPFQKQEEDVRELAQFLSGDWSGVKTSGGKNLVPETAGEVLSENAEQRPTNPNYDAYQPNPEAADTNAPGVGFAIGEGRSAASALGFAGGAALAAPAGAVTAGLAPIAAGVSGSIAASNLFDQALKRGAAYGVPGFQQIQNDLAAQGTIEIPGVGKFTPDQIASLVATAPLAATTLKNLASQAVADTARRGAIYAAAKASLQGTAAAGAAALSSAAAQKIQNGTIDPQKTAIDTLLGVATMMPEGSSLRAVPDRVEDHIDFDTMKNATPDSPVATSEVKSDLDRHASALPPAATSPDFEVLEGNAWEPEEPNYPEEKSPETIDVQSKEVVPQEQLPSGDFIEHKGVSFDPALIEPSQSPEDDLTKLVAAHLADGIRSNGLVGQKIALGDDPDLPAIYTSSQDPKTIFINPTQIQAMASLDDYDRQIYFDRASDEESKHQATIQAATELFPEQSLNQTLVKAFDELTPEQQQTIANGYGAHIGEAWNRVQGGQPSPELKGDMVLEGARMVLQQRAEEPTTEQMMPETNFSTQALDPLIKGATTEAPVFSALLDHAQKIDSSDRKDPIPFRDRHPNLIPRISASSIPSVARRGLITHTQTPIASDNESSSRVQLAPATYLGEQKIPGRPSIHLYNLTQDIPSHPQGSTVSDQTLTNLGYRLPDRPIISGSSKDILKKAYIISKAKLDDYIQKYLTPEGTLPREVLDVWHDTEQQKAAIANQAMFLLRDVKKAVKTVHGNRTPNAVVMAREMQVINDALKGKFQFKPDSPLYLPIKRMREFIDGLSDELIRSGATDSSLIPHIEAQKGFYLTRSYQAFDDPNWWKKWEKQVGLNVANRAKSTVASWVMDDWASEPGRWQAAKKHFMTAKQSKFDALESIAEKEAFVRSEGLPGTFTIDDKDALTSALLEKAEEWTATPEGQAQVRGEINSLVRRQPDGQLGLFRTGKLGSKNINILKSRKEIPEVVRQMMGEYKGADINFSKSSAKMAALWQHHQFLETVKSIGLNKFLFEKKQGENFVPIAADGSKTMAPLNGLYTTPDIAEAFQKFNVVENLPWWARQLQMANLLSKLSVTTLNPASIGHNLISQTSSWLLRGHWMAFNPANWKVPIATLAEREGWEGIRGLMGMNQGTSRAYLDRMTQLGVLEQNAFIGDMAQTLQDTLRRGETLETLQGIGGKVRRTLQMSTKTHEIPNSITKMLQFEAERARYAKAIPVATPQQLDMMAAKAVRATTPTYAEVPKAVRALRKFPFFGPFISFASEVYRNYFNAFKWAAKEWKNPATRGIAIASMVGILLYSSLFKALSKATATANNIDSKDEQKFRKFLPPWSRNSQLILLSNDGKGKLRYLDSSYITHSSMVTNPVQGVLDGKDLEDSIMKGLGALSKPFSDPQMGTGASLEAYMNGRWTPSGNLEPVSNAPSGSSAQIIERLGHASTPLIPGIVTAAMRLNEAMKGNVTKYGQNRTIADEIERDLGFNVTTLDLKQSLKFQAQAFVQSMDSAEQRYRSVLTREGNVAASELNSAYLAMEQERQSEFNRMNDLVVTAKDLGVSTQAVASALSDAHVDKRQMGELISGNYVPYQPGKSVLSRAYQNAEEQGTGKGIARISPPPNSTPVNNSQ